MISVIIVNYNAGALLGECILRVLRERSNVALEVIVVDNASSDTSLAPLGVLVSEGAPITVVSNEYNLGFSKACNQGANLARGDYLLFLNPDCLAEPGALSMLIKAFATLPAVGMAGGLIVNSAGKYEPACNRQIPSSISDLTKLFRAGPVQEYAPPVALAPTLSAQSAEAISGACMMVSRSAFDAVGGWDEDYFLHAEDLDLCRRFHDHGFGILFVPGASFIHHKGTCSRARPVFVEFQKHRGMWKFYRKFYAPQRAAPYNLLVATGLTLHFIFKGSMAAIYSRKRRVHRIHDLYNT